MINLSAYSVVEVTGRDALVFLQAQTMNDVASLSDGQWQWNGLLNAKGRVLFLFQLMRIESERYWLLQAVPRAAELTEHLGRFRFRSKVNFDARAELHCMGIDAVEDLDVSYPKDLATWSLTSVSEGVLVNLAPTRTGWLLAVAHSPTPAQGNDGPWFAASLRAGIPRIADPVIGVFTPQMLALERISAYSIRKGCYPGQEIVARTHFLGSTKRHMQLLTSEQLLQPGQALSRQDGSILGQVADSVATDGVFLALGVLTHPLAVGDSVASSAGPLCAIEWT